VENAIVEDPRIKALSFTGGVSASREVYAKASQGLKRVALELGSKNPLIVMDDADIELAVLGTLFGAFGTAGQRCTATSRLIFHKRIYDEILLKLLQRTKALRVGLPLESASDVGPVCCADQEKKILEYIDQGKKEGAGLLCGGSKLTGGPYDRGFFIDPTIFETTNGTRITREEIFGPVCP
jgi:acyl-CoA reductase-like NAD-dependent aldehyde dehydrogenase